MVQSPKVAPGQRVRHSADRHNHVDKTMAYVDGLRRSGTSSLIRTPQIQSTILVENTTAIDVPRGGVLGLDGPTIIPESGPLPDFSTDDDPDNLTWWANVPFKGVVPVDPTHYDNFAVTLGPIAPDETGRAVVSGIVNMKVSVETVNESSRRVGIVLGATGSVEYLATGYGPGKLLWRRPFDSPTDVGVEWATVLLGNSSHEMHLAKLSAALDFDDATGVDATIYVDKPAVVTTAVLTNVVASEKITESGTFASGSFVWVEIFDGKRWATGAPCS